LPTSDPQRPDREPADHQRGRHAQHRGRPPAPRRPRATPTRWAFHPRAAVRVTIFAAIAAVLLFAVLHTISPF
jgi:hypothetical protein